MDINQFEWDVVKKRPTFWVGTLHRLILIGPLFIGLMVGATKFGLDQKYLKTSANGIEDRK